MQQEENKIGNYEGDNGELKIQDIWRWASTRWYWFLLSLIVAIALTVVYLVITPPVYTRKASILVKDDSKGGISSEMSAFSDISMFKSNVNINNELATFKSPLLMAEVIQRLQLDETFSTTIHYRKIDLYGKSPVTVMPLDSTTTDEPVSYTLDLLPNNEVRLSNFVLGGTELSAASVKGRLSDPIVTPVGLLKIIPTFFYHEGFQHTSIVYTKRSLKDATNSYLTALTASINSKEGSIIDLIVNDVSTQRAEDILNMLILIYNENWIRDKNQIAISTSMFINERLLVIEEELGGVDDEISQYKSRNLLPDVQAASSLYMAQSTEDNARITALNTQYSIAKYIQDHLKNTINKDQVLPANLGIENGNIENQIQEYNTMLLRRNSLQANSSDKNPLVIDLNQSLESMKYAILNSIENMLVNLDTQLQNTRISRSQTNARIASNPTQAKYLLSVERQQKIKEALYLFLLQKREENELTQAFTAYNTKVIVPPSGTDVPTSPKRNIILLAAFMMGLLVPGVIIYLLETMNTKVRGRKDLEGMTIPFVGEIPYVRRKLTKAEQKELKRRKLPEGVLTEYDVMVEDSSRNYINEAFRVVRTNIDFMQGRAGNKQVLMLTSFNVNSGKSFVSINLAISEAIKGRKIVVVDMDMRKAALSGSVGLPEIGLADYLAGGINEPEEIMVKGTYHPNLSVIPVGSMPPNPVELLLENRLDELMSYLRGYYDYIFLDCPPLEVVADATIIANHADLALFIVREGLMDRRMLPAIENLYYSKKFESMAMLLNGTHYSLRYGYGYGGYGSGYYGYGN